MNTVDKEILECANGLMQEMPDFESPEYEDLLLALINGICIFIGAGISKLAGYKLWEELRNEMIEYFWKNREQISLERRDKIDSSLCKKLRKHADIIEAFDYLFITDRNLFRYGIKEIFEANENESSDKIFQSLSKLRHKRNFFITTNIDRGLQRYLGLIDEFVDIYPILNNPSKMINYLHGRIDKENTWIFTREQYNSGYLHNTSPCMDFLIRIFENHNVLFIGYGLREDDIKRVLSLTRTKKSHWWLEAFDRDSQDFLKIRSTTLKNNYNITLVPYSIETDGHDALYSVLDNLYNAMTQKENAAL